MNPSIEVEVDQIAGAAYFRMSAETVHETVEAQPDLMVDLDRNGVVVGVELLRLGAPVPWESIGQQFHIRSEVVSMFDTLKNAYLRGLELTQGPDSTTVIDGDLQSV